MFKNLIAGFRLAFFFTCDARDFRVSALNLWCIFILITLASCLIDYCSVLHPVRFNSYGILTETFFLSLLLFAGFLLSLLFRAPDFCLSIPLICLNALFAPFILGAVLRGIVKPEWMMNPRQMLHFRVLCSVWFFLIFFRLLLLFTGTKARRQIVGALLLLAVFFLPGKYLYLGTFWYQDHTADNDTDREPDIYAEDILQQQDLLLNKQLAAIAPRDKKARNTYVVLFAGYGDQTVFMKEVLSARKLLEDKYNARGRSVALINNKATLKQYPLATVANLRNTLNALGHKADPKKDMLLLYLTSHGAENGTMSIEMNEDIWLRQLNGAALKKLLKDSGFEWKVVIISACYSGAFIDALRDEKTLVMTSARKDRTSFGCGDEFDMTYFGDALFRQALPRTADFIPAFNIARAYIEKRENEEHIEPHSEPQIAAGYAIRGYLDPDAPVYGPVKPR